MSQTTIYFSRISEWGEYPEKEKGLKNPYNCAENKY